MLIRPRVFLTCLALFLVPLVFIAGFNYWSESRVARASERRELDAELSRVTETVNYLLNEQESELLGLTRSAPLRDAALIRAKPTGSLNGQTVLPLDLRVSLASILTRRNHFAAISCFDQNRREVFLAERGSNEMVIREKDFLPGQVQPDGRVWTTYSPAPLRSPISSNSQRPGLQITVPIMAGVSGPPIGAVVGNLELDSLLREAAGAWRSAASSRPSGEPAAAPHAIIVLDNSGTILYHPNQALLHQPMSSALPELTPLSRQMLSGESGWQVLESGGKEIAARYAGMPALNLSVAVIDDYPEALISFHRSSVAGLVLSVALGCVAAFLLARFWERRARGIDRVTKGVAAIAQGDLNHRIDARSSDAIRPLSDNLNMMTAQLRDQIARETEARQFQSFIRLSAMLTHDLKNAIEALSLIVGNMERHFDNEAFRADAMKSLNLATQNLRSLVYRLTNPVTTLSGEYKRPQPVDLVALLRRVISLTAEPALGIHQIETELPGSLPALADAERLEKVIENLILNGLEAMAGKGGKLSIEAGRVEPGKVFFSVSDTGPGMARAFIENQLFRPFATTKKRGVGLGLYTCREVVQANGGTIEVDSQEGAGTTFRVVLPSAAVEQTD